MGIILIDGEFLVIRNLDNGSIDSLPPGTAYDGFGQHTATNPVTGQDEPAENSLYATKVCTALPFN